MTLSTSMRTSAICSSQPSYFPGRHGPTSFLRSPQPTYIMMSLLENLDRACEMTVFPQPKAPGIAVVPPCTHLKEIQCIYSQITNILTGIEHPKCVAQ